LHGFADHHDHLVQPKNTHLSVKLVKKMLKFKNLK